MALDPSSSAPLLAPVLVVEDDDDIRSVVCALLEDEGIAVDAVDNGVAAITWLSQRQPRLVVLDMTLPGASGDEVAAALHRQYAEDVPLVIMTADWRADERAKSAQATTYVRKPFDIENLLSAIHTAMGA